MSAVNSFAPVSAEAAIAEATELIQRLTIILASIAEHTPTSERSDTALLDLNSNAVLRGDIAGLGKVQDGAHGGELRDSKRVDPRLRLIYYREVDGHRRTFIDGVAQPLVGGGA